MVTVLLGYIQYDDCSIRVFQIDVLYTRIYTYVETVRGLAVIYPN